MTRLFQNARILFAVTGIALGGAATAHAEAPRDPGCEARRATFQEKRLARLDTDHDGVISPAELEAGKARRQEKRAEVKDRFDLNKDGVLDENERAQMKIAMSQRMFEKLDVNKDGQLTPDEVKCGPLHNRFAEVDTDKSGSISSAELAAAAPRMGRHGHHRGHV